MMMIPAWPLCMLIIAGAISSIRAEGFHNGPVTFGSGDQAHPGGAKSFSTITLGGTGGSTVNTQSFRKANTATISSGGISLQPRVIQVGAPQVSILGTRPQQIQYGQDATYQLGNLGANLRIGVLQSEAPSISYLQGVAPRVTTSQAHPSVSVSGGATSHGYSVNAPGLTKTATFGYSSGNTLTVRQGAPQITAVQAPRLQFRVPQQQQQQQQIHVIQGQAPQLQILEAPAPQISVLQTRAPQLQVLQAPSPTIRIQQSPAAQFRIKQTTLPQIRLQAQQPQIYASGPATSHGYTVNAPGLTKTATFGYPSGGVSITQSVPRVRVSQAPKVQLSVAQPQLQVHQAPAPQIRIQQAPAPQVRVQAQQPKISVSGPATSHGYTVNAPGLTKTATFGYPSGGVSITQSAPRVTVSQAPAPRVQVRVARPQLQVLQAPAPQIRIQQAPAPRIRIQQASLPQIRVQAQQPKISVSGPATSHGYTVNAPGLTKTATFGYPSGGVSITQSVPRVRVSQAPAPRVQVRVAQPQLQVLQAPAPQIRIQQAPAPQIRIQQAPAPQIRIQQAPAPQIRVQTQQPKISVSGPATSHGYSVNAPGLTKTATFGYPSGGATITQSQPRVSVSQVAPKLQLRVPQQQLQIVQARAPQISVLQAPAPQFRITAPAPQVQVRAEQPAASVSGPATSHGYSVNAPGLTKTATFGYPYGGVSITQSAPRISVAQQAPKLQLRVPQQEIRVVQAPAPQIRIQQQQPQLHVVESLAPQISVVEARQPQLRLLQAPTPQIRIQQAPATQLRVQNQQTTVSASGPATSHGYSVNAPGLTKTATFGYPSGGVSFTQSAPRVSVSQQAAPKLEFRVAQPQLQVLQAPSPQIRIHQAPSPQVQFLHSPGPQVHLLQSPAPQVHLVHAAAPQFQVLQPAPLSTYSLVGQPQISLVKSYQPQVQVIENSAPRIEVSQPQTRTIQLEAPKTITTSVSGFSAPSVRQQAFNTPSHGYSVSAPGFTKHKTFSGPSVYGTHQDGGVSGASGIGHVDLSVRQGAKAKA